MGWLWMCLGIRDNSTRRIRDAEGRVSSDSYDARFDSSKIPRIEDYLQPRRTGYDVFVNRYTSESPNSIKTVASSIDSVYADGNGSDKEGNKWAHQESHVQHRRVENKWGNTNAIPPGDVINRDFRPHWSCGEQIPEEKFVSRETSSSRKSFSELLMETDALDSSTSRFKGPLALAAIAAAAERAARSHRLHGEGGRGRKNIQPVHLEACDQPPHSISLSSAVSVSSLSKKHLEASQAVAAFKENRRRQMSERTSNVRSNGSIRKFFRSSRKRPFRRALSPVLEVLSLDEELRSKRKSDVSLRDLFTSDLPQAPSGCAEHTSTDSIPSAGDHQQSVPRNPSAMIAKVTGITSESLSTEKGADCVDVVNLQENWEAAGAGHAPSPLSSTLSEFAEGRRQETPVDGSVLGENGTMNGNHDRNLDEGLDTSSSASLGAHPEETALGREDLRLQSPPLTGTQNLEHEPQDDVSLLRTPVRDILVSPEVFMSPKTNNSELNFTRIMDVNLEERPILGSLADHWEAALTTKKSAWDGKGIPNSTHKYREDQKVMWHSASFEERLVQALATQEASVPQRRSRSRGLANRLAAGRSDTGFASTLVQPHLTN